MKCKSCKVIVGPEFVFAIRSNQCPACGKEIIDQIEVNIFKEIKQLAEDNKLSESDKIALILLENLHNSIDSVKENGIHSIIPFMPVDKNNRDLKEMPVKNIQTEEQTQDSIEVDLAQKQSDPKLEAQRIAKLKRMQQDILASDSIVLDEQDVDNPIVAAVNEKIVSKQQESLNNIITGAKGLIRRGG